MPARPRWDGCSRREPARRRRRGRTRAARSWRQPKRLDPRPRPEGGHGPFHPMESSMASEGYHEPIGELSDETRDMHRAIVSLMEELEAVDWYNQRVDACKDPELKAILAHNRDEEKEHAAMVLEWIRRRDDTFSKELKDYLFTSGKIGDHH